MAPSSLILTAATGYLRITVKVSQPPSSCFLLLFVFTPPTTLSLYNLYFLGIGLARRRATTTGYPICLYPAHESGDANAMADGKATCFKGRDGICSTMDTYCVTRQFCFGDEGQPYSRAEKGGSRYVPVCVDLTTTSLRKCQWVVSRN